MIKYSKDIFIWDIASLTMQNWNHWSKHSLFIQTDNGVDLKILDRKKTTRWRRVTILWKLGTVFDNGRWLITEFLYPTIGSLKNIRVMYLARILSNSPGTWVFLVSLSLNPNVTTARKIFDHTLWITQMSQIFGIVISFVNVFATYALG